MVNFSFMHAHAILG